MTTTGVVRTATIGALVRRRFRVLLDVQGIQWTEYRGWLDSEFVIRADPGQMQAVTNYMAAIKGGGLGE